MHKFMVAVLVLVVWAHCAQAAEPIDWSKYSQEDIAYTQGLLDKTDCRLYLKAMLAGTKDSKVNMVHVLSFAFAREFGYKPFDSHQELGPDLYAGASRFCQENLYAPLSAAAKWYGDTYGIER